MPRENWRERLKKIKFSIQRKVSIGIAGESTEEEGRILLKLLANDLRLDILCYIVKNEEKEINISKLQEDINKKRSKKNQLDYKSFLFHLKVLEEAGLIKLEKKERVKGRPVMITSSQEPQEITISWGSLKFPVIKIDKKQVKTSNES